MSLLELDGTTVRYGGVTAVDTVSFTIEPATLVGLIGPNGAGKTTMIDAITGMTHCAGDIRLGGESITAWPVHRRSRAGLVRTFQSLELFMDLTVRENLQTYARPRAGSPTDPVEYALERLEVGWAADLYPAELSAGTARLVSVARALAADPRLLLLDEPAAGLDAGESRRFGSILRRLVDEEVTTVLLVDHDVDLIMSICDDIQVLDFGRKVASGTPSVVRKHPEVTRAYLGTGSADEPSPER